MIFYFFHLITLQNFLQCLLKLRHRFAPPVLIFLQQQSTCSRVTEDLLNFIIIILLLLLLSSFTSLGTGRCTQEATLYYLSYPPEIKSVELHCKVEVTRGRRGLKLLLENAIN